MDDKGWQNFNSFDTVMIICATDVANTDFVKKECLNNGQ
jgi:hypothetical protein